VRVLLDTHVLLWWVEDPSKLSATASAVLTDPLNELYLSSASVFEMGTKVAIGKLKLRSGVEALVGAASALGNILPLPVTFRHCYRLSDLPLHHRDPFDRLLIAQAAEEDLVLATDDRVIARYPVKCVW